MFAIISLMFIWLAIEKTLALIIVSHMGNIPPLSPLVLTKNAIPTQEKPPQVELSQWEKFEFMRQVLKQGIGGFGISENTQKITYALFRTSTLCKYFAIIFTALSLIFQYLN